MKSSIAKRSVVIGGHKTSVSLEEPFWSEVRSIAARRDMTISSLLREISEKRLNANLSSAVRVFVLEHQMGQMKPVVPHNGHTAWPGIASSGTSAG